MKRVSGGVGNYALLRPGAVAELTFENKGLVVRCYVTNSEKSVVALRWGRQSLRVTRERRKHVIKGFSPAVAGGR